MAADCIFCKIIAGEIPANKVYEDEQVLAFHDIAPQAPVHVLVVPKKHVASVNDLHAEDTGVVGQIFMAAQQVAQKLGVAESGYRVVTNCGRDAGQVVFHLHFHVMGGKPLGHLG